MEVFEKPMPQTKEIPHRAVKFVADEENRTVWKFVLFTTTDILRRTNWAKLFQKHTNPLSFSCEGDSMTFELFKQYLGDFSDTHIFVTDNLCCLKVVNIWVIP